MLPHTVGTNGLGAVIHRQRGQKVLKDSLSWDLSTQRQTVSPALKFQSNLFEDFMVKKMQCLDLCHIIMTMLHNACMSLTATASFTLYEYVHACNVVILYSHSLRWIVHQFKGTCLAHNCSCSTPSSPLSADGSTADKLNWLLCNIIAQYKHYTF